MDSYSIIASTAFAATSSLLPMETFFPFNNVAADENESIEEFLRICQSLRDNDPNTTTVSIGHHVDQARTAALCEALIENTQVQRIRLDFANDLVVSKPLLNYLQYSQKLSIVDMLNLNFSEVSACTALLLLLKGIARNRAVRELTVEATLPDASIFGRVSAILYRTQKECLLLHSGIAASFRQLKFIEYLWLEHIDDVLICQILPSLRHLDSLKTLSLIPSLSEQSDTTFDSIGALLTTSASLQLLELHDCLLSGSRMNAVVRGLWNSESVTELGLHTCRLDAVATDQLRALYCRRHKARGATISALTIGHGVKLRVPLVGLLQNILGSGKSTLECLDLKSRDSGDEDVLKYLSGRSAEEDWFSVGWKSMTGHDTKEVEVVEAMPQLVDLKWGKIKTEESLALFEDLVLNQTNLLRLSVEVDEGLDPGRILSLSKASNIEICTINGERYDVKSINKNAPTQRKRRRKVVKRQLTTGSSDEEQQSFEGSFDGIGLEACEAQAIDEFCDHNSSSSAGTMLETDDLDGNAIWEPVNIDFTCKVATNKEKSYIDRRENDNPTANSTQPIVPSIKKEAIQIDEINTVRLSQAGEGHFFKGKQRSFPQSREIGSTFGESVSDQRPRSIKDTNDTKRRVPSRTRSDSVVIAQMQDRRIADIRKNGGLRHHPFFFVRRSIDPNDYGEVEAQRPALRSTASDTNMLSQMQSYRAQRFATARQNLQDDEPELPEENEVDIAEALGLPMKEPENLVPTSAEEVIAMEHRELCAGIIGMLQTYGRHSPSSSGSGSEFDEEEDKSLPIAEIYSSSAKNRSTDELGLACSPEMQGLSNDISNSYLEGKRQRVTRLKKKHTSMSGYHSADRVDEISVATTTATALEPHEDESSPRSFGSSATSIIAQSVNHTTRGPSVMAREVQDDQHDSFGSATVSILLATECVNPVARTDGRYDDDDDINNEKNSTSSELLDFDLELSKIMST